MSNVVVQVDHVTHAYGDRTALDDVSLSVNDGELFGFLGPNGSGKTTLFRLLSTLIPPQRGTMTILGCDVVAERAAVREQIGVVFQSPSLDKKLTAAENLLHHGHLYGLRGGELRDRMRDALDRVRLLDRADEYVERFSGGQRRRVELAKGMLNRPRVLLLDEPSTGLDPTARIDLWHHLRELQSRDNMTILLTTHLMDEADRCTRLAVLDRGRLVACDSPNALKSRIGGDVITMTTRESEQLQVALRDRLSLESELLDGDVRVERPEGHRLVPQLIEAAPGLIESVSVGKPTLEDVFIRLTGHVFEDHRAVEDVHASSPVRGQRAG
jgi:ABC-2 type transport system ATP-binding protein